MNFLYNLSQACQNWHKHYMNMIINIQNEMGVITTTLTMTKTTKKSHKHCRCHRRRHHHHHYQALPQLHLHLPSGSSVHAVTVPFQAKGPDQAQTGRRLSGPWNHWRSIDCQPWLKTISGFREKIRGGQPSDVGRILPKVEGQEHGIRYKNVLIYLEFGENIKLPPQFLLRMEIAFSKQKHNKHPLMKVEMGA